MPARGQWLESMSTLRKAHNTLLANLQRAVSARGLCRLSEMETGILFAFAITSVMC